MTAPRDTTPMLVLTFRADGDYAHRDARLVLGRAYAEDCAAEIRDAGGVEVRVLPFAEAWAASTTRIEAPEREEAPAADPAKAFADSLFNLGVTLNRVAAGSAS